MHRPIWRCVQACNKDKCTIRSWNRPQCCPLGHDLITGLEPIWERYESKKGQKHLDGLIE